MNKHGLKMCVSMALMSMAMSAVVHVNAQSNPQSNAQTAAPQSALKRSFQVEAEARRTPVKDQAKTNICWNFATSSFLESEVMRLGGPQLDLSEVYAVRMAYPLKADAYVRAQGKANFWEGGNNHDTMEMLRNYGAVPRAAYTGLKDGETVHNHAELASGLKAYLDSVIKSGRPSRSWKLAYDGILDGYLGKPPSQFEYAGKTYTPQTFRDQVLKINPDDYVEVTSFSHHPFYQRIRLEIPDNWAHDQRFLNLPLADMEKVMVNALNKGFTLSWGGDTSERGFNVKEGVAFLDDESKVPTQQDRQETFDDWRTADDHSMHVVGMSRDEKGGRFFITKNSYGTKSGPYAGYIHMSENYVRLKTIYFMVHKDAIPMEIRIKAGIK
jgi:bleomycin hydrolase